MGIYAIQEDNFDRLTKKLIRIKNKCAKYGKYFHMKTIGEEYRKFEYPTGENVIVRYILVDVTGSVVHDGWEFVAVIDHAESGNIIRQYNTELNIPDRYFHTAPICEHCKTKRNRKDTYLIHNVNTDEWKQVGKTCLTEFTNGMDADEIARYISLFDTVIAGNNVTIGAGNVTYYFKTLEVLQFAFETIKHFGYQKNSEFEERPTRLRCMQYYNLHHGMTQYMGTREIEQCREEMLSVNFNAYAKSNVDKAQAAIEWASNVDTKNNSYLNNLSVICNSQYCASRNLGFLVSLVPTYLRHLESAKLAENSTEYNSEFVGAPGDKVSFSPCSITCVYSNEFGYYGPTYMYKITDKDNNVYMWSTSKQINIDNRYEVSGVIKKHEEYKGVKQTWLIRCRLTSLDSAGPEDSTDTFEEDSKYMSTLFE